MKLHHVLALVIASSSLSHKTFAVVGFDQVTGKLSAPFQNAPHLNFVEGLDTKELQGWRFHGHYSAQDLGFPKADHNQLADDDLPQDAVAALLQRLFPSPVHDTLTPNALVHDHVRRWITPASVARIVDFISQENYADLLPEVRLSGLLEAFYEAYQQEMVRRKGKKIILKNVLSKYQKHDAYAFAVLLDNAVLALCNRESKEFIFYGPHAVQKMLFGYMGKTASTVDALAPYYEAAGLSVPDLSARLTQEAYKNLKEQVESGAISIDELTSNPEMMLQLRWGFDLYDNVLPPIAYYSMVVYQDPHGKKHSFANCVEMSLLTLFATLKFDPRSHDFDATQIQNLVDQDCALNPAFHNFYENVLTVPSQTSDHKIQTQFSQLVSNLNTADSSDPIVYRQHGGKAVQRGGTYEILGIDNFMRTIGVLLGDKEWKPITGRKPDQCVAIAANLDRLCELFSKPDFKLSWKVKDTEGKKIKDTKQAEIVFSYHETEWFSLSVGAGHGDFEAFNDEERKKLANIGKKILAAEKPWHPYFALFIKNFQAISKHTFQNAERFEEYVKGYLFASDLDSLEGRGRALKAILNFYKKTEERPFDFLLTRWLSVDGKYFNNWEDKYTNYGILNLLAEHYTLEQIEALNIPAFTKIFDVQNLTKTLPHVIEAEATHLGRLLLSQEGALQSLANQPINFNPEGDDEITDEESSESREDGEGSEQSENDEEEALMEDEENSPSLTLIEALAILNLPEFIDDAVRYGAPLSSTQPHNDDLNYIESAIKHNNPVLLQKLSALGTVFTAEHLHFAMENLRYHAAEHLMNQGLTLETSNSSSIYYDDFRKKEGAEAAQKMYTLLLQRNVPFNIWAKSVLPHLDDAAFERAIQGQRAEDLNNLIDRVFHEALNTSHSLAKLRILKAAGANAKDVSMSSGYTFAEVSPAFKEELYAELFEMGYQNIDALQSLSPAIIKKVLRILPNEVKANFCPTFYLRTAEDLLRLKAFQEAGITFKPENVRIDENDYAPLDAETLAEMLDVIPSETREKTNVSLVLLDPEDTTKINILKAKGVSMQNVRFSLNQNLTPAELDALLRALPEDVLQNHLKPNVNLNTQKGLRTLQSLINAGVPVAHISTSMPGNRPANTSLILSAIEAGLPLSSMNLSTLDSEYFANFVDEYPEARKQELTDCVANLCYQHNALLKLQALHTKGVDLSAETFTPSLNGSESLETRKAIVLLLVNMGLKQLPSEIKNFEASDVQGLLEVIPAENQEALRSAFQSLLQNFVQKGHLETLQALARYGVKVNADAYIHFDEGVSEDIKGPIVITLLEMGLSVEKLNHFIYEKNDAALIYIIEHFPEERMDEMKSWAITDYTYGSSPLRSFVNNQKLAVLQSLRRRGFTTSCSYQFTQDTPEPMQEAMCRELMAMGADIETLLRAKVGLNAFKEIIQTAPIHFNTGLTYDLGTIETEDDAQKACLVYAKTQKIDFYFDSVDENKEMLATLALTMINGGIPLEKVASRSLWIMDDAIFKKFVEEYPAARKAELTSIKDSVYGEKLKILSEAGII